MACELTLKCFENAKHLVAFSWMNIFHIKHILKCFAKLSASQQNNYIYRYLPAPFPEEPMRDVGSQYFSQNYHITGFQQIS